MNGPETIFEISALCHIVSCCFCSADSEISSTLVPRASPMSSSVPFKKNSLGAPANLRVLRWICWMFTNTKMSLTLLLFWVRAAKVWRDQAGNLLQHAPGVEDCRLLKRESPPLPIVLLTLFRHTRSKGRCRSKCQSQRCINLLIRWVTM